MIAGDQPTCFPSNVLVAVSSKSDGTVLDRAMGVHDGSIVSNRTRFCDANGVSYGDMVYQRIIYGPDEPYDSLAVVGENDTTKHVSEVAADALYTTQKGVGLFLPVADCAATVLYDAKRQALAVAHLGRHSTYAGLAGKVLQQFMHDGSDPRDITVWMSPHAQKQSYRLDWFDRADDPAWQGFYEQRADGYYLDMAGYNARILKNAGILPQNIHVSAVDTMTNPDYFSHAGGDTSGRIGVIAMLR